MELLNDGGQLITILVWCNTVWSSSSPRMWTLVWTQLTAALCSLPCTVTVWCRSVLPSPHSFILRTTFAVMLHASAFFVAKTIFASPR